ncbi:MAG: hypothetical protein ABII09_11430 [Planctomycetota bacterium]
MLLMANFDAVFAVVVVVVCVIILVRVLLLAGRFVRAVEKIAEKIDKNP